MNMTSPSAKLGLVVTPIRTLMISFLLGYVSKDQPPKSGTSQIHKQERIPKKTQQHTMQCTFFQLSRHKSDCAYIYRMTQNVFAGFGINLRQQEWCQLCLIIFIALSLWKYIFLLSVENTSRCQLWCNLVLIPPGWDTIASPLQTLKSVTCTIVPPAHHHHPSIIPAYLPPFAVLFHTSTSILYLAISIVPDYLLPNIPISP